MFGTGRDGFTLVELLIVIVVIGILVGVALPNYLGATDRARVANTRANMHTAQTMLETYAADWAGLYPASVTQLESDAGSSNYLKIFRNPLTGQEGAGSAWVDHAGAALTTATTGLVPGAVYYDLQDQTRYTLYASDSAGRTLKEKGVVFVLTNN